MGLLLLFSACQIDPELEECPYNVRLEHWYVHEDFTNRLPGYLHSIRHYIFDEQERLVQVNEVSDDRHLLYSELMLPPGKYTVVAWANIDTVSRENNVSLHSPLQPMSLYPQNPYVSQGEQKRVTLPVQADNERLFYAKDSFHVREYGITRKRINFTHSHLRLNVLVQWRGNVPPDSHNFNYRLRSASAAYRFTSDEEVDISSPNLQRGEERIICRIPQVIQQEVEHRTTVKMGISLSLRGEFITYRLRDEMHPIFCAYAGNKPLMKEIDLSRFFRAVHIGLNRSLRQEYDLLMEILPNGSVLISLINVSDWENGGVIGDIV